MDYYFYLHPPKATESFGDETVVDFDALTARKRVQMQEEWTQDSRKGEPV